jgi:hypothetical protein
MSSVSRACGVTVTAIRKLLLYSRKKEFDRLIKNRYVVILDSLTAEKKANILENFKHSFLKQNHRE